jgi:glycine amidinotransferase
MTVASEMNTAIAHEAAVVSSYNEWDPLEEVIVGVIDGARVPPWHVSLQATTSPSQWDWLRTHGGSTFPEEWVRAARIELEQFMQLLDREGVTVRCPDAVETGTSFSTPDWEEAGGVGAAMPRDLLLVIGERLIETPMAWRSRYFEISAYRTLLIEYFRRGAQWVAAPKPLLKDELYDPEFDPRAARNGHFVIRDIEPTFDAADFIRCGADIFVQRSHVTNPLGIDWLRRSLGPSYRIHELGFADPRPLHIDATFMPLAPGKLLVNPERVHQIPALFRDWDVLMAPPPAVPDSHPLYLSSKWLTMNVLMLDENRIVVEENEHELISALRRFGLEPLPCPFRYFYCFGGSFHCATLDVRRRGTLQTYFS